MKIAVLSDIHANYVALETVSDHIENWQPDLVFVAGDIVNRGPRSLECLGLIQRKQHEEGWMTIRGNHEDYVISRDDPKDQKSGPWYALFQPVHFAYQQLNCDVTAIQALPAQISHPTDFGEIRVMHASMRNNRDGIYPETKDESLRRKIAPKPTVFITGHTHRPVIRHLDGTLVVNAGSVGLHFDGDIRPMYAQITHQNGNWQADIIRVDYDHARAEKDYEFSGYLEGAGPLAQLIRFELHTAYGQLYEWTRQYATPILNGQISVEAATQAFLENPITQPYW